MTARSADNRKMGNMRTFKFFALIGGRYVNRTVRAYDRDDVVRMVRDMFGTDAAQLHIRSL